jgi:thymidylate synthase
MYYMFKDQYRSFRDLLLEAPEVDVGKWHAMDVKGIPNLVTQELHCFFHTHIPRTMEGAQRAFEPNLPWAEDQFQERVSGYPSNPGETYKAWPWQSKMEEHVAPVFSHTYMERYWPKMANGGADTNGIKYGDPHEGIRYPYGDLSDVVALLAREPYTRQAYLPVWFPEDTGGVHGGRLPCSLGYHFLLREGKLNCTYFIRSCDFVRHFRDDIYLTARLTQWVAAHCEALTEKWEGVRPGDLTFHCPSLHIMKGDRGKLKLEKKRELKQRTAGVSTESKR